MTRTNRPLAALLWILAATTAGCAGDSPPQAATPGTPEAGVEASPHGAGGPAAAATAETLRVGTAREVIEAAGYVYVLVGTEGGDVWIAAPAVAIEVGTSVETPIGSPMPNFRSAALDRTFEVVWFVPFVRPAGSAPAAAAAPHGAMDPGAGPHGSKPAGGISDGAPQELPKIEPLADGLTVAGVFGKPAGTEVALRGLVVKLNRGILGFDWIHLQDGTGSAADKSNDLLVLVAPGTAVKPGDVVVARGKVGTDKDFGSGYTYALLVEEATVTVE